MRTKEVKIEIPKGFEVDKEKSTFERIVFKELNNSMEEVYRYHNTTQEDFDKLYLNIPSHVKAYQKECMVVAFYNKSWVPNWEDSSEKKYYLWFYLDNFRLDGTDCDCDDDSVSSARLCFRTKEDALEAFERFPDVFKESRMFN